MTDAEYALRKTAIHLLRGGNSPAEVAEELGRSRAWVYKWRSRFFASGDWQSLRDQTHAPQHPVKGLADAVWQAIRQTRSELEAEASQPDRLSYVGAPAIQARLRHKHVCPLPSLSSIERELHRAGMVQPRTPNRSGEVMYPHLTCNQARQLVQVDILPHYLTGGVCVACFNAIDVVSRYPTGQQVVTRRSQDAVDFLGHVWRELGIPEFTQVDNEGCFSGGYTHPGVLGKVLRLGLLVGTQLLFSPFYHPQSNGTVERFHQEYAKHVWDKFDLPDLAAVRTHSTAFYDAYRHSQHHAALKGRSPAEIHSAQPGIQLPDGFRLPSKLPVTVGQVHFMRRVTNHRQVKILNLDWDVPRAEPGQGVWATLQFTRQGARLGIWDTAPDHQGRRCLAEHPFLLNEAVLPLSRQLERPIEATEYSLMQWAFDLAAGSIASLISTMW